MNFFHPRYSLGHPKMHIGSFFQKSLHFLECVFVIRIANLLKNESGNGDDFILLGDIFRRIAWPNTPNTGPEK